MTLTSSSASFAADVHPAGTLTPPAGLEDGAMVLQSAYLHDAGHKRAFFGYGDDHGLFTYSINSRCLVLDTVLFSCIAFIWTFQAIVAFMI